MDTLEETVTSPRETPQPHIEVESLKEVIKVLKHQPQTAVAEMASHVEYCNVHFNGLCGQVHRLKTEIASLHHQLKAVRVRQQSSDVKKNHHHMDALEESLKAEMKGLHHQQRTARAESASDVKKCRQRMETLDETVRSLRETPQLHGEMDCLKAEIKALHHQQEAGADKASNVKKCFHCMDILEDTEIPEGEPSSATRSAEDQWCKCLRCGEVIV
ncbi:hypothetical protein ABVT39_019717 [Epinephelus coioides]